MNNETPIANAAIAKHRLSGEPFDLHGDFSEEMRSMERRMNLALTELEKIRTEKVLCGTCGADEANAVSKARHILSNSD